MKKRLNDINDPELKFELIESDDVDGEYVLAKVKGVFFVPDGMSRNGRWYPKSLWERVLDEDDVKSRLADRSMFGTVGHETTLDDKAVLEGLVSHIVTKMEIDENNRGMGEALIINTPAGRTLNTILRAGGQMYVSTRANGTLSKETYQGKPIVEDSTYDFQTVDFVCRPGFLKANPKIAESLDNIIEECKGKCEINKDSNINEQKNSNGDSNMNEQLVKLITNENAELKLKVGNLTDEIKSLTEGRMTIEEENKHLTGEMGKLEEANKIIDQYNELGESVESIKLALELGESAINEVKEFKELGESVDSIKTALELSEKTMVVIQDKFGSLAKIEEALNIAIDFKNKSDKIGTLDQFVEALEKLEKITEERDAVKAEKVATDLAEELELDTEKVKTLLEKYSVEDIKELYGELSESAPTKRFKKAPSIDEDIDDDIDDELYESRILSKSYAERI